MYPMVAYDHLLLDVAIAAGLEGDELNWELMRDGPVVADSEGDAVRHYSML
jgi:hypothetical protein